jgi:hypothetical protein
MTVLVPEGRMKRIGGWIVFLDGHGRPVDLHWSHPTMEKESIPESISCDVVGAYRAILEAWPGKMPYVKQVAEACRMGQSIVIMVLEEKGIHIEGMRS